MRSPLGRIFASELHEVADVVRHDGAVALRGKRELLLVALAELVLLPGARRINTPFAQEPGQVRVYVFVEVEPTGFQFGPRRFCQYSSELSSMSRSISSLWS